MATGINVKIVIYFPPLNVNFKFDDDLVCYLLS